VAEAAARKAHLVQLQQQVEQNERVKKAAKVERLAEGQLIKGQLEAEKAIIEVWTPPLPLPPTPISLLHSFFPLI